MIDVVSKPHGNTGIYEVDCHGEIVYSEIGIRGRYRAYALAKVLLYNEMFNKSMLSVHALTQVQSVKSALLMLRGVSLSAEMSEALDQCAVNIKNLETAYKGETE